MVRRTGVRYDHRRVYRLIGPDLYSAPADRPLGEQAYTVEAPAVLEDGQAEADWRVIVREGEVCLAAGGP